MRRSRSGVWMVHMITDVELPPLADYWACCFVILATEAFAVHGHSLRTRFVDYGEATSTYIGLGGLMSGAEYVQALRGRRELCAATFAAVADLDLLVTAALPSEAVRTDEVRKWGMLETPGLCQPFNVTGWPAISICSGFGAGEACQCRSRLPPNLSKKLNCFVPPLLTKGRQAGGQHAHPSCLDTTSAASDFKWSQFESQPIALTHRGVAKPAFVGA